MRLPIRASCWKRRRAWRSPGELGVHHLQGAAPAGADLVDDVDRCHAAASEEPIDAIVAGEDLRPARAATAAPRWPCHGRRGRRIGSGRLRSWSSGGPSVRSTSTGRAGLMTLKSGVFRGDDASSVTTRRRQNVVAKGRSQRPNCHTSPRGQQCPFESTSRASHETGEPAPAPRIHARRGGGRRRTAHGRRAGVRDARRRRDRGSRWSRCPLQPARGAATAAVAGQQPLAAATHVALESSFARGRQRARRLAGSRGHAWPIVPRSRSLAPAARSCRRSPRRPPPRARRRRASVSAKDAPRGATRGRSCRSRQDRAVHGRRGIGHRDRPRAGARVRGRHGGRVRIDPRRRACACEKDGSRWPL